LGNPWLYRLVSLFLLLTFLLGGPQGRGAEDKVSSQHGLRMKGREVPLCPNNTPEEPNIVGASK